MASDVLTDSSDGVEERAWVRVSAALTIEDALALAMKEEPPLDGCAYEPLDSHDSRSWHLPVAPGRPDEEGNEFWVECEADADGAVEFWDLIVGDPEEAQDAS